MAHHLAPMSLRSFLHAPVTELLPQANGEIENLMKKIQMAVNRAKIVQPVQKLKIPYQLQILYIIEKNRPN